LNLYFFFLPLSTTFRRSIILLKCPYFFLFFPLPLPSPFEALSEGSASPTKKFNSSGLKSPPLYARSSYCPFSPPCSWTKRMCQRCSRAVPLIFYDRPSSLLSPVPLVALMMGHTFLLREIRSLLRRHRSAFRLPRFPPSSFFDSSTSSL